MNVILPNETEIIWLELEIVQMELVNVLQEMLWQEWGNLVHFVTLDFAMFQLVVVDVKPSWQQEHQQVKHFHCGCYQPVIHQDNKVSNHLALSAGNLVLNLLEQGVALRNSRFFFLQFLLVLIQLNKVIL